MSAEKLFAALGLLICLGMLLAMALGPRRRLALKHLFDRARHWRRHRADAQREALEAIDRARRAVERDGNVYRPKSFSQRPPKDKLH